LRYRALSATGDYTFGQGEANFLINSPAAVAQSVLTRLRLWEGEWFLDQTLGTPYTQQILGYNTAGLYDLAIQQQILNTPGVTSITQYSSSVDPETRALTINAAINTQYGPTAVTNTFTAGPTSFTPALAA
jgi:hypothetical protein